MKFYSLLSAVVLLFLLGSCSDEPVQHDLSKSEITVASFASGDVTLEEGIFSFTTNKAFDDFYKKLESDNHFKQTISEKYGSYLLIGMLNQEGVNEKTQHLIDNVAPNYLYFVSKNHDYIIGNEYFRYGIAMKYSVDKKQKNSFNWNDEQSLDLKKVKSAKYGRIKDFSVAWNKNARLDINLNQENTGGIQHPFWQQTPAAGDKKWVNEIDAYQDGNPIFNGSGIPTFHFLVVFRVKLEWKGSGSWKPAGEYRYVTPTINYTIKFGPNPDTAPNVCNGCTISPGTIYQNTDYNRELANYYYTDYTNNIYSCKWYLTGNASVTHRIEGDVPANTWTSNLAW